MPQLVKGGKHVFGWTIVGDDGSILVPQAAREEYGIHDAQHCVVIPGSRTSGGFGLGRVQSLRRSFPGAHLPPRVREGASVEGEEPGARPSYAVVPRAGIITVPPAVLRRYGVAPGDRLLVVRGSGLALGFVVRGPLVAEAARHPELDVFCPGA